MLTVTFAFVVATALLFLFASTRALGVVGVFILLCLSRWSSALSCSWGSCTTPSFAQAVRVDPQGSLAR